MKNMNHKNKHSSVLLGVLFLVWMLGKPRCNSGCRTVAEHLLIHVLETGFLAV